MMEYSHILKSNYHTFLQSHPHCYAHHFNMEDQKKSQHSFLLDLHMVKVQQILHCKDLNK